MERSLQAYQVIEEDLQDFVKLFKKYQELNYKPNILFNTDEELELSVAAKVIDQPKEYQESEVVLAYEKFIPYLDNYKIISDLKDVINS